MLLSSHTAPLSVLPNLVPSDLVMSGRVKPHTSTPFRRRVKSIPLTILPH
ncbi:Uncharacterised protein [Vibrio cholerae]|nr:Uncharacterised protein [Vibrio cholerae]